MTKMLTFLDMSKLGIFGVFEHLRRCSSLPKDAPVFVEDAQKRGSEHLEHLRGDDKATRTITRGSGSGWQTAKNSGRRSSGGAAANQNGAAAQENG